MHAAQLNVLPLNNALYRATLSKKGSAIVQDAVLIRHSHIYRCVCVCVRARADVLIRHSHICWHLPEVFTVMTLSPILP